MGRRRRGETVGLHGWWRSAVAALRRWLLPLPPTMLRRIDTFMWALALSNPGPVPFLPALEGRRQATDEELCRAWCATYAALQAGPSLRAGLALVDERRAILDELARRSPAGFAAWLVDATPGDASPPGLSTADGHRTVINWDQLIGGSDSP